MLFIPEVRKNLTRPSKSRREPAVRNARSTRSRRFGQSILANRDRRFVYMDLVIAEQRHAKRRAVR
jgi:hypothetical protein